MRGLSPAYLRIGGTTADQKVFTEEPNEVFQNTSVPTLLVLNCKWKYSSHFGNLTNNREMRQESVLGRIRQGVALIFPQNVTYK